MSNFNLQTYLKSSNKFLEILESGPIHEISEINEDRTIPVSEIEVYGGVEMFYTNSSADWLIYLSHENTITIAGAGTRVPIETLSLHLEKGVTLDEFLEDLPIVSKE